MFSHVAALSYVPWGHRVPTHWEFLGFHLEAPAVNLFFVLSGHVVAQSLRRRPALLEYVLRRAVRLLPVASLAVLLGLLARIAAAHAPADAGYSVLISSEMQHALTGADRFGAAFLGLGALNVNHLNPPLWTLIVELQMVPLMPLLSRARNAAWLLLAWAVSLFAGSFWSTATFIPLFLFGALLASFPPLRPEWRTALLLGLAVLLQRYLTGGNGHFTRFGAVLILLAVQAGAGSSLLSSRPVRWLGRVSYSLYAVHFPVMLMVSVLLVRAGVNLSLSGLLAVPFCLLAAAASYRLLEQPALALLARRRTAEPQAQPGD